RRFVATQRQERLELDDPQRLGVQCSAAPDLIVFHGGRERVHVPMAWIGGNDVHVMQQYERRFGAALETRPDVAAPRGGRRRVERNALLREDPREELHRAVLIPRWVGGVDLEVLAHPLDGFVLQPGELRRLLGQETGNPESRRQGHDDERNTQATHGFLSRGRGRRNASYRRDRL